MKKYIILIVDDELINLENLIDAISQAGKNYKVLRANSSKMALKILEKATPDIIITDWDMPEINGIELIKQIKSQEKLTHIPIIMCSGVMTTSENLQTALNAGANDYIRKPIDPIELHARLESSLKLSASYLKIKELNATKDKFFSIIAHDLKSPFNTILGFSKILLKKHKEYDNEKREGLIKTVNNSANSAFELLENLLTWSRSQSSKIIYTPENHYLKILLFEAMFGLQDTANKKEIQVLDKISENDTIFADKNMITTVLRNLISNAIKFTPRNGTIIIAYEKQEENDFAEISIIDTGVGIPKDEINNLFRIDKNTSTQGTENEQGTGLGLILCKEFIKKHGGKIWVESEIDKGSSFYLTIPFKLEKHE